MNNDTEVNATYSHLVGDRVLRDIATFLKNNTRHNVNPITGKPDRTIDGIYRFGGEEILLLLKILMLKILRKD